MIDYSKNLKYTRHGGPYDRGSADSYYQRDRNPHYFVGNTSFSARITLEELTDEEIAAYNQGFDDNEKINNFKQYD